MISPRYNPDMAGEKYFLYILECSDASYYIGIARDPFKRLHQHNHTKGGAKYVRGRRPARLVYLESHPTHASAAKRECALRRLKRAGKEALIQGGSPVALPEVAER